MRTRDVVAPPAAPIRLRSGRPGSLRLALVLLAVSAFLLGALQLVVGLAYAPGSFYGTAIFTATFWVWIAAGVTAWWRRPSNGTGALIVVGGFAVFLSGLGNLGIEVLTVVSTIFATSMLGVAVQLLHSFPSGRLNGRLSVAVVIAAYAVSLGLQAPRYFIRGEPALAGAVQSVQSTLGIAVMAVTVVILVGRLRAADRPHRRVLLPLFLYGSLAVLLIPITPIVLRAAGAPQEVIGSVQLAFIAGLPVAFLVGVLLGGFSRTGELGPLSAWLGLSGAPRATVARAMASTLGDDTLQVVYWSPDRSGFVDADGAPAQPAADDDSRTWFDVRVESRLVGAIVYDNRIADADLVRRAAEVLAIAIDRERLTAELRASNDALLQSRLRLVETADRERTRIAQDLHDGLQVQLVLLALEAQQIGTAPDATEATHRAATGLRQRIDDAAAELRRLVHNVLPAALVERGLTAAAEDLVDRLAIPATLDADIDDRALAPATTHTAYFIIAEALTNAVKHSHATAVQVTLRQTGGRLHLDVVDNGIGGAAPGTGSGSGLKGLADRIDVLGGSFTLESPHQQGTRVKVELPCGS